ncbi:transcriptional repressor TraM (plasmid) [Agrobacterium sp. rho-13.3]|uniref:transcriptional repressor TraM n=1 Tax=Agrobacterium sp. rho-13.3 TaxID=3072980 RepID=UPI002A0B3BE2|nr:transcriptional repressor TraM [Agrobacterium sp. rho-13.3]MDX8310162.1 transcriptional repressor TraM [Agrobacterium sp. rho-13.3]
MKLDSSTSNEPVELRAVVGLTKGLPLAELEAMTSAAIHRHRTLVEEADNLFQALPENYKCGKMTGGDQHVRYIEAAIEMHAQMTIVATLVAVLGYVPRVSIN